MTTKKRINFKLDSDIISPSPLIKELLELFNKDNLIITELLDVIQKDILLTTTILRYANSAYFGSPCKISSLLKAIELIGLTETRNIAICNALQANFKKFNYPPSFNYKSFWLHSLLTANIAKELTKRLKLLGENIDENDAYITGLLHDIGWIAIALHVPEEYDTILNHDMQKMKLEKSIHGIVGMTVAKMWNLPTIISDTILYHSIPRAAHVNKKFVNLIHISSEFANCLEREHDLSEDFFDTIGLTKIDEKNKKDIIIMFTEIFKKTSEIINNMDI